MLQKIGLGGLLAIIGIVITAIALLWDVIASNKQDSMQMTQIALMERQVNTLQPTEPITLPSTVVSPTDTPVTTTPTSTATNEPPPTPTNDPLVYIQDFELDSGAFIKFEVNREHGGTSGAVDDGTGNMVYRAVTTDEMDSRVRMKFGPESFGNGSIKFEIRFRNFPEVQQVTREMEDWGSIDLFFRREGEEGYVFTMRPVLMTMELNYVGADENWAPIEGGETGFSPNKNQWYTVVVDIEGNTINVTVDGDNIFSDSLNYSGRGVGFINFSVRPRADIEIDNIEVIQRP